MKILVVDDDEQIRSLCSRALQADGHRVETAVSADAAAPRLEEGWDLVVADLDLPGRLNGNDLARLSRAGPGCDVIVITGNPQVASAVDAMRDGAYDYIPKPFSLQCLSRTVRLCGEKRRLSEELGRERILREELSAAYSELQKVERLRESILSIIGHELRTPLAVSLFAAEAAEERHPALAGDAFWMKLKAAMSQLRSRVEDLFLHAQLGSRDLAPRRERVCLQALLRETAAGLEPAVREMRLAVHGPDGETFAQADPTLLGTAFRHLLLNAVHFNVRDGRIALSVERREDRAVVEISNTGESIPPEALDRVFDSFYQAADFMTRRVGGLGIGLAIVRRIIEAHGGEVRVASSRPGEGTVFRVTLPAA